MPSDARRGLIGLRASLISVAAGMPMVSTGNAFALERRDEIVRGAQSSEINTASRGGDHICAALPTPVARPTTS